MIWSGYLKWCAKRVAQSVLGDYAIYRIYELDLAALKDADSSALSEKGYDCREVSQEDVRACEDEGLRVRASYGGDGALAFAVRWHGQIVCLQWYWFGDRYRQRNFWPLQEGEAKSIDLYTVPAQRGKGLVTILKIHSAAAMKKKGFRKLSSRVWHSHTASCRVHEKAGWRNIALVAEVHPLGMRKKLRYVRWL